MTTLELTDSEVEMIRAARQEKIYKQGFYGGLTAAVDLVKLWAIEAGQSSDDGKWDARFCSLAQEMKDLRPPEQYYCSTQK